DYCYVQDYGVTQGTSLGPILFLFYINSIPASLLKGKLFMFADDIALVNTEENWSKLIDIVETDLQLVYNWMEKNLLSLNVNKSVCTPIVTNRSQLPVGRLITLNEVYMYGTIGVLSEFKPDGDWTVYQERMEQYFLANMIPEERKVPLLITCMGEKAYIMLKDLCDPLPPAQCTYAQLCTLLTRQ
ncbi:Uncharacterized protein FWK35_00037654, partial [Aphis craccivora]